MLNGVKYAKLLKEIPEIRLILFTTEWNETVLYSAGNFLQSGFFLAGWEYFLLSLRTQKRKNHDLVGWPSG